MPAPIIIPRTAPNRGFVNSRLRVRFLSSAPRENGWTKPKHGGVGIFAGASARVLTRDSPQHPPAPPLPPPPVPDRFGDGWGSIRGRSASRTTLRWRSGIKRPHGEPKRRDSWHGGTARDATPDRSRGPSRGPGAHRPPRLGRPSADASRCSPGRKVRRRAAANRWAAAVGRRDRPAADRAQRQFAGGGPGGLGDVGRRDRVPPGLVAGWDRLRPWAAEHPPMAARR